MYTFEDTGFNQTEKLEQRTEEILETLRDGNVWRYGNGISLSIGVLGLLLGNVTLSPLVLLLLSGNVLGAVFGYFGYCLDESETLGILPNFLPIIGGEEETTLSGLLTEKERLHFQAVKFLGAKKVTKIEQAGGLDILLDQIEDLADHPEAHTPAVYSKLMRSIKDGIILGEGSDRPARQRSLPNPPVDPWDSEGVTDRLALPVATDSTFNWATITKRPHLFVLGDTGSGKTALTQWLVTTHYPRASEVLVLDPHDVKGQWGEFSCVGRGRNFDAIELALEKLVNEMDTRYATGSYEHPPKIVIIEEIPAIAANCKTAMSSIACLALEARKVKIFLIVLSQGWEVESLGLKGKGSVRDSFCFISLGEFAKKKAKDLGVSQQIKSIDRPCFVGDELATVPELNGYALAKEPDIRSSLDRLYDSATAAEPTINQPTPIEDSPNPSKIDALSDAILDELLIKVLDYAKRKERVKPSDITSGIRAMREYKSSDIMQLFYFLEGEGSGTVRGSEFIPN